MSLGRSYATLPPGQGGSRGSTPVAEVVVRMVGQMAGVLLLVVGILVLVVGGIMDMLVRAGAVEKGGKHSWRREWRATATWRGLGAALVLMIGMLLLMSGLALLLISK